MIVYEDDEPFDDAMIPYMSFEGGFWLLESR